MSLKDRKNAEYEGLEVDSAGLNNYAEVLVSSEMIE